MYERSHLKTIKVTAKNPHRSMQGAYSRRHSTAGRYNSKLKDPEKAFQKGYAPKTKQYQYIDIDISCKYNITSCVSYTLPTFKGKEKNQFRLIPKDKYSARSTKPNSVLRKDFIPLFEESREDSAGKAQRYHRPALSMNLVTSDNEIKELTQIKIQKVSSSTFQRSYYYDPRETLFRHSFDRYAPDVHKYITSNIRAIE